MTDRGKTGNRVSDVKKGKKRENKREKVDTLKEYIYKGIKKR